MEINEIELKPNIPHIGTAVGGTFAYYWINVEDTSKMLTIM